MAEEVDDFDRPDEVVAVAATQRRVAITYGLVFTVLFWMPAALTVVWPWWSSARLVGGMSPGFAVAALGLYGAFVLIAVIAGKLARDVEDRMLGGSDGALTDPFPGSEGATTFDPDGSGDGPADGADR